MLWIYCIADCILSSDSDFTSLVIRLKESGKQVYGFGQERANIALVQAYTKFYYPIEEYSQKDKVTSRQVEGGEIQNSLLIHPTCYSINAPDLVSKAVETFLSQPSKDGWVNTCKFASAFVPILREQDKAIKFMKFITSTGLFAFKDDNKLMRLNSDSNLASSQQLVLPGETPSNLPTTVPLSLAPVCPSNL